LTWQGSTDPNNDNVQYKVYFGTDETPDDGTVGFGSEYKKTVDSPNYTIKDLKYATQYYWKVVATDGAGGQTEGPVWSFTTKKELLSLTNPTAKVNNDGTIDVTVTSESAANDFEVYVYYQSANSSTPWSTKRVKLKNTANDVFEGTMPKGGFLSRNNFDDYEAVGYWFVVTDGTQELRVPKETENPPYFFTHAINGSMTNGLAVINPGYNMVGVKVEHDNQGDVTKNKIIFTNKHSLYLVCSASKDGQTISDATSSDDVAQKVQLISKSLKIQKNNLFIGGNKINLSILHPLTKCTLTFPNVYTAAGENSTFRLKISRNYWMAYILDGTSTFFDILNTVAKKTIKADTTLYNQIIQSRGSKPGIDNSQNSEQIEYFAEEIRKAYVKTLIDAFYKDINDNTSKWYDQLNYYFDLTNGYKPGRMKFLFEYILGKTFDKKFEEKFFDNFKEELKGDAKEEIIKDMLVQISKIATNVVVIAKGAVTVANLDWKLVDLLTLPPNDEVILQNKQLYKVNSILVGPTDKSYSSYPDYMKDVVQGWHISRVGNKTEFKISVANNSRISLSNIWVGMDIYAPDTLNPTDGTVVKGEKIENTYTPISDDGTDGTTHKGLIKFNAYKNGQKIATTYVDPTTNEKFGQGVMIGPGETVNFKADYSLITSVTGYQYTPGIYDVQYAVWKDGYPGSFTATPLVYPDKIKLMVIDDKKPTAPFQTEYPDKPFNFIGKSDGQNVELGWTGVNKNKNKDVVYYRLQRADNSSGPFQTIALVYSGQYSYIDADEALTLGNEYYYKLSAMDNGGNESVNDMVSVKIEETLNLISPSLISPSNGSSISTLTPSLYWTTPAGDTKYRVQLSDGSDFNNVLIDSITTQDSLAIDQLKNNNSYYWRVEAVEGDQSSDWSETYSFRTNVSASSTLEVTPKDSVILDNNSGTFELKVQNSGDGIMNWNTTSDQDWLNISYGKSGVNDGVIDVSYTSNGSAKRIGHITISADNASGSPKVIKIIQNAPVMPDDAGPIYGEDNVCMGSQDVNYSIDSINNASYYEWKIIPDTAADIYGNDPSVTLNWNPNYNGLATLKVRGDNQNGSGAYDSIQILVPGKLTVNAGNDVSSCSSNDINLSGYASNYKEVLWKSSGDGKFDDSTNLNTIYIPGNQDSISNSFKLYLIATPLFSKCSSYLVDSLQVTISRLGKINSPSGPDSVNTEITRTSTFTIDPVQNANRYHWYVYPEDAGTFDSQMQKGLITWKEGYEEDSAFIKVVAGNDCDSISSDSVRVKLYTSGVGVNEIQQESRKITIYPNPNRGKFYIKIPNINSDIDIVVLDMTGSVVLKRHLQKPKLVNSTYYLDLSTYPQGLYFVSLKSDNTRYYGKIIIQKSQ